MILVEDILIYNMHIYCKYSNISPRLIFFSGSPQMGYIRDELLQEVGLILEYLRYIYFRI